MLIAREFSKEGGNKKREKVKHQQTFGFLFVVRHCSSPRLV
jgi:hypothetical protein